MACRYQNGEMEYFNSKRNLIGWSAYLDNRLEVTATGFFLQTVSIQKKGLKQKPLKLYITSCQ